MHRRVESVKGRGDGVRLMHAWWRGWELGPGGWVGVAVGGGVIGDREALHSCMCVAIVDDFISLRDECTVHSRSEMFAVL